MARRSSAAVAIADVPLVASASPVARQALNDSVVTRRVAAGETLFAAGDAPSGLYVLLSGAVLILAATPPGREVVANILQPRSVFGDSAILAQDVYGVGARAATACQVAILPLEAIERARAADPGFAALMLRNLLRRLQNGPLGWMRLVSLPAPRRVAGYMAMQPPMRPDGSFRIPVRKTDLASYLQLANATFSRAVRVLQDESLIRMRGRWVTVPDRGALSAYARERTVCGVSPPSSVRPTQRSPVP